MTPRAGGCQLLPCGLAILPAMQPASLSPASPLRRPMTCLTPSIHVCPAPSKFRNQFSPSLPVPRPEKSSYFPLACPEMTCLTSLFHVQKCFFSLPPTSTPRNYLSHILPPLPSSLPVSRPHTTCITPPLQARLPSSMFTEDLSHLHCSKPARPTALFHVRRWLISLTPFMPALAPPRLDITYSTSTLLSCSTYADALSHSLLPPQPSLPAPLTPIIRLTSSLHGRPPFLLDVG